METELDYRNSFVIGIVIGIMFMILLKSLSGHPIIKSNKLINPTETQIKIVGDTVDTTYIYDLNKMELDK